MSPPVIEVRSLSKSFGPLRVLADVSLCVKRGERRLILGPNGAGKTTLFNIIAGVTAPTAGAIDMEGRSILGLSAHRRAQAGLCRTFQIITLFPNATFHRNVVLALLGRLPVRWNFLAGPAPINRLHAQAEAMLHQVGLSALADIKVDSCSYGEKRRLEIALALACAPRVLLLDEPFAGLSSEERESVRLLLRAIPREVSVVMIEHDMDVALSLAEAITVLHHGRVIADGTKAEVLADPRTQEVYLGT